MISIKMSDGSRYDTEEWLVDEESKWAIIKNKEKTVHLNPYHIVSITVKEESA